jgi:O-antigen/teichoic acid export membrane protein
VSDTPQSEAAAPEGEAPETPPEPAQGPTLGERAVSGSVVTVLRFAGEYGLRLGSNLILTRILVPEDFGLMALVSVLMTGLAMFSDVGIATIVIQNKRGDDPTFLDTVWTVQVIRGAVLTALAALLGGTMAEIYDEPRLRSLIWLASLTALVGGFNSISLFKLQRHLRVKKLAAIELTAQLFSNVVTITWALVDPSVWALVWGGLVGSAGKMLLSHTVAREHRCRFAWERRSLSELIDFGKWIFLSTVLFFLAGQSDRLIFGRLLSMTELGVFSIALTFATTPTQVVWRIGNAVVFPALSRRRESEGGLVPVYRRAQMPLLVLGSLPVIAMIGCASELIEVLYDPRYANAGWMLQLLGLATWVQIPQASSGSLILAVGIPRWIAIANGVKFVGLVICLPLGWFFFGTAGAIAGLAGAEVFRYVTLAIAVRGLKLPILRADIAATLFVAAVTLTTVEVTGWLGEAGYGALVRMAAGLCLVIVLWVPGAALLLRREIPRLRDGLEARRAQRRAGRA